jgi:tight adherence protein B
MTTLTLIAWLAPLLFAISIGGLTWVIVNAVMSGSEAYNGAYSESTAREFEDVFLFIPPKRLEELRWAASAVIFLLAFMVTGSFSSATGFAIGFVIGLVLAGIALYIPTWTLSFLRMRRLSKFNSQLVDTLVSMSNALKAGFSIAQAFESVAKDGEQPIAQEFDVFLQQTRVGVSFSDGLTNMDERVGSLDLTLVVMAIETSRKTGGNLTEILGSISRTIRERMRIENRIKSLTAQGRLQGIVVGAMPIVIAIAMLIVDPETMKPFLYSMTGLAVMATVVVLITLGGLMIRKIINIDV